MAPGATIADRNNSPWARARDLILPIGIIGSVLVIMVPLPPMILDLLLAANITIAVIVLLTTVYVKTPLEFSIFPSLLLATTLGRLVLNVATTRLILTRAGTHGMSAAGEVIGSFADFVAGNNIVVGLIIFVIIVVIQFVVITKGATRISEVAARFALDGMPGRQMAIDADLNAGIIDEKQAQRRREEITEQADFFGAMDGASKFVRGDAIAGIIITLINIVGGLIIGVAQLGMGFGEAASLFTKLTIGDGLVSQVPAFLISLAAGLLVTRSTREINLPSEFMRQLFSRPPALAITGGFLGVLIFTSLPTLPLMALGGGCVGLAVMLSGRQQKEREESERATKAETEQPAEERVEDFLSVDPMEFSIGVGLIRLADPKRGGDLLDRIKGVRQMVAQDIGIVMPKVRIRDDMRLEQNQYRLKIADMPVADGLVYPEMLLAMDSGMTTGKVPGIETREPAFNTPATWIDPATRSQAELYGYTIVEAVAVLATHLTEVVRQHADELLTRDATKHLIDELKETSPTVVEELIPNQMKLYEVQKVLACVDWFEQEAKQQKRDARIGVVGYGEGGMIALYAAALDPRIDATIVSGYFDDRNAIWSQPIDRNVFGLLDQFGDAELAAMVAGRGLIIDTTPGPKVTLAGRGGAPAVLKSPQRTDPEFTRALKLLANSDLDPLYSFVKPGDMSKAVKNLVETLGVRPNIRKSSSRPKMLRGAWDASIRQARQIHEIDRHNQRVLRESQSVRQQFMKKLYDAADKQDLAVYKKVADEYREHFATQVIGRFDEKRLPPNVRTRKAYDNAKCTGY
ncbi:MAG: flagellar type III secretion system protein FlhA, partial [Planctomycetes bacterium]|nr:flagellar type III secretion system protein FlhA [Planctomycetota bacterium]